MAFVEKENTIVFPSIHIYVTRDHRWTQLTRWYPVSNLETNEEVALRLAESGLRSGVFEELGVEAESTDAGVWSINESPWNTRFGVIAGELLPRVFAFPVSNDFFINSSGSAVTDVPQRFIVRSFPMPRPIPFRMGWRYWMLSCVGCSNAFKERDRSKSENANPIKKIRKPSLRYDTLSPAPDLS